MLDNTRSRGGAKTYEPACHLAPWRCRRAEKIIIMPSLPMGERFALLSRFGGSRLSACEH